MQLLLRGDKLRLTGDVLELIGIVLQIIQLNARAPAEGVIVMPLPLWHIHLLHEPCLGRAGIEIAKGHKGVVGQRVEVGLFVGLEMIRIAHRPAVRFEVDDV